MSVKFEPKRLRQARAMRRMTLADLGARTDLTRQGLSQFEKGDRNPSAETMVKLAGALEVPIEFLTREIGPVESSARSMVHYRSIRRTRDLIIEQERASAILDICAAVLDTFQGHIEYQKSTVPKIDDHLDPLALSDEDVEAIAQDVRARLGIGSGPISDVTLLVENQAVAVVNFPLPTGMDGLSAYYGDRPFIVVSSEVPYARGRLNIAHEFGHLVLHQSVGDEYAIDLATFKRVEDQAWRFAGAFLLPHTSFLRDVYSTSLEALLSLKEKWGVSIGAIIMRLQALDVLDREQVKYLRIQMAQRGWSKVEPGDDRPRERARLFRRAADYLKGEEGIPLHELASESRLPSSWLASALDVEVAALLPPRVENVIQFTKRAFK